MSNNKARLFQLYRYLYNNTDEKHFVTTQDILRDVRGDGDTYSRNTVPSDIKELQDEGFDVVRVESSGNYYYLGTREFEMQELRLLIDAVAASRFITTGQSDNLIAKLRRLTSKYQAEMVTRNLYTSAVKSTNPAALYAVDIINDAINRHQQIWFQYVDYSPYRRKVLRHGGRHYTNSPYGLVWDNDHYYVVGWSEEHDCVVQFRVDRMKNVQILEFPAHDQGDFSMETYVKENFQMYSGTPTDVTLLCRGDMMNAWVFQFGGAIKILGPANVVERYQEMLRGQMEQ